jgi:hypothetical protein
MSAPPTSLPAEIAELMWQTTTIGYEQYLSQDGNGGATYMASVDLTCWVEPHGYGDSGMQAKRPALGQTTILADEEPVYDVYFDGDSVVAQVFSMNDRFTVNVPAGPVGLKPRSIETLYGPNFDNVNPWIIAVHL